MSVKIKEKKAAYFTKLVGLFQEYKRAFIVDCDMVGSKQIQNVRLAIRGKGEALMGKNTMIRKCLRDNMEEHPHLEALLPHIQGNTAFIFVKEDFDSIRDIINANFVGAAARAGVIAPIDVSIPKGVTSLQPTETSFFQALNISTKITKGSIEILADVDLIHAGRKVMPGEAALLQKLGIKPFTYGLDIVAVYENGNVFDPAVLDITDDDVKAKFLGALNNVAALCLAAGYPTLVSVTHSFLNGYKNVLAVSVATDYTFPLAQKVKDFLADPNAMAAAAAAAAGPAAAKAPAAAAKAPEPEPVEEEEEDVDFDLFD
jgi:large subunit ribosomal protein LP0